MSASPVTADRLERALAGWHAASPGTMMEQLPLSLAGCRPETNTALLRFDPMPGWMSNTFGAMHGGLVATLLDSAMGLHAFAATGDEHTPTVDLQVSYLWPTPLGAPLVAESQIVHQGRSLIFIRATLRAEGDDRPCATASGTYFNAGQK